MTRMEELRKQYQRGLSFSSQSKSAVTSHQPSRNVTLDPTSKSNVTNHVVEQVINANRREEEEEEDDSGEDLKDV